MTFISIIASNDKVYFIADTLFSDDIPVVYSLDNQKIFVSRKHRIAMCICDHVLLVHKEKEQSDYFVNHVLREFFHWLDQHDNSSIETFQETLLSFVDSNYSMYHNYFRFQSPGNYHERDCYYFYAGFQSDSGQTVVYKHFYGIEEQLSGNCGLMTSNHQKKLQDRVTKKLLEVNSSLQELLCSQVEEILFEAIPLACQDVNAEKHYSVGPQLHCIVFNKANQDVEEFFYEYKVTNRMEEKYSQISENKQLTLPIVSAEKKEIVTFRRLNDPISYVQFATLEEEIVFSTQQARFISVQCEDEKQG